MNYALASACEEMNPSRRNTMEDVHRIVPQLGGDSSYSYFGVYDGHGGRQIVDFMEENLEKIVYQELKLTDDASIPERLSRAFLITDMESKKNGIATSGATCVSALLHFHENKKHLYIANVGDSRAVLCSASMEDNGWAYHAERLSHDHTADDPLEQSRIRAAGGFVTRGRVLGILAVARSFGDHGMKDFVIAQPDIAEVDLTKEDASSKPFLILACDGLWDVMADQEAVDFVVAHCKENSKSDQVLSPNQFVAEALVEEAIERGTTDNVTAVVVFF